MTLTPNMQLASLLKP
ncbi:hypothetical protein P5673_005284 [Acropora cervicornis]|uniref:Uncharacterized protein n=1 Tax=Acropora cervicornis TaxID=6130 RepID=A0AAD9QZY5_ACRCE|nr:hypothetical protein P5673_005284 [Acropora cervicornis]